jgi:LmbE family N-acetylglucosaminyl deacetylase
MKIFNMRATRVRLCFLLASLTIASIVASSRAQQTAATQQTSDNRIALYQALLDLANPWTVMCVAAHPDDEDGTSLIVMRRKYGAHTVSLFSTFGEGGQNAIGPELYEELGAIRARETMAASEIQGSEAYFLGLKDFGFSKSRDEAFQKWGHEEALQRMVLQIRKLRPDVIITNHSTTSNDHGHHQATARLVVEAFEAAADPAKFPEQLKNGVTTWQVQRLFVRQRGAQAPPANAQLVTIDPNERDAVRGTLFAEQALSALQQHATQGPWPKTFAEFTARFRAVTGQAGATGQMPLIRYRLEREATGTDAVPKDSHNFLEGLRLPLAEASELSTPTIDSQPLTDFLDQPARIIKALETSWTKTRRFLGPNPKDVPQNKFRMSWFIHRTTLALAAAHGITTSLVGPDVLSPGSSATFKLIIRNGGAVPITLAKENLSTNGPNLIGLACCPTLASNTSVAPGGSIEIPLSYSMPVSAPVTVPHAAHLYGDRVFGTTVGAGVYATASTQFWVGTLKRVDVAPPFEIAEVNPSPVVITRPEVGVSSAGADIFPATPPKVSLKLINHTKRSFKGEVAFGFENRSPETRVPVDLLPEQTKTLAVTIPNTEENRAAHLRRPELANSLWFSLRHAGLHENLIKSSVPVVWLDARVARRVSVGYVRGFDFSLPNALNALGVESKELSVDEVKTSDLSKFSSIIVDNRVYESHPELIATNQKLLDYAQAGGNLIVFYHRIDEFNPNPQRNRPQLSPYKLILGNERITDENASISFLEPDHPLLNSPNKLNQDDFKDWIQERGLYYPREWDPQFKALLQSNDPGEAPLKGGLLVADYGTGHYIYTSMVWYRQLRAGVPGAYRMLANMISYGSEGKR